jgi:hypothetical protein
LNAIPPYPKTTGYEPCATTDPELWFPEKNNQYVKITLIAKDLCRTCPIQLPCASYALGTDVEGIWGATDEQERKQLQKEKGIEPFRFIKAMSFLLDKLSK